MLSKASCAWTFCGAGPGITRSSKPAEAKMSNAKCRRESPIAIRIVANAGHALTKVGHVANITVV